MRKVTVVASGCIALASTVAAAQTPPPAPNDPAAATAAQAQQKRSAWQADYARARQLLITGHFG